MRSFSRSAWLLCLCLWASQAWATTYYVAPPPTGNNSRNCTQAQDPGTPKATIQHVDANCPLTGGDTVSVGPGTYAGNLSTNRSGTSGNRLRFVSSTPLAAKLVGNNAHAVWEHSGPWTTIEGFDVSGGNSIGLWMMGSAANGQMLNNYVHDITWGNTCSGNGGAGINYEAPTVEVSGNTIERIGLNPPCSENPGSHGIYGHGSNATISRNIIRHIQGMGLIAYVNPTGDTITRNSVSNTGSRGIYLTGGNHVVTNNIVFSNPLVGISLIAFNTLIANNTVYANETGIKAEAGGSSGNTLVNNLIYNNSAQNFVPESNTLNKNLCNQAGGGCELGGDPQFVQPGVDFHVRNTGAGVNTGSNQSGTPGVDFDDKPRPEPGGTIKDIGAFECQNPAAVDCVAGPPQPIGPVVLYRCNGNLNDDENGFTGINNGVLTNGTPIVVETPTPGNSCVFNGINQNFSAPNNAAFRPAEFCFGVWINPSALPTEAARVMELGTTAALGYGSNGQLFGFINNGPTVAGSQSVVVGQSTLIGLSFKPGDGLRLWKDGSNIDTLNVSPTLTYSGTETLAVGGSTAGGTPAWFQGRMDNIRMNDQACTPLGMQQWYQENQIFSGMSGVHTRFRADSAGFPLQGSQDTDLCWPRGRNIIVEWDIANNSGSDVVDHYTLYCAGSRNGFASVEVSNTPNALGLMIGQSALANMGDSVPVDNASGYTPVAGRIVTDTVNKSSLTTLPHGGITTWRWNVVSSVLAQDGDSFRCKPRRDNGAGTDTDLNHYLDDVDSSLPLVWLTPPPGASSSQGGNSQGGMHR